MYSDMRWKILSLNIYTLYTSITSHFWTIGSILPTDQWRVYCCIGSETLFKVN